MPTNPVLTNALPFALPDFAAATPTDYRSAFEIGMAEQLAGWALIREGESETTGENVLGAWEDAEATLRHAHQGVADGQIQGDQLEKLAVVGGIELAQRLFVHLDGFEELALDNVC